MKKRVLNEKDMQNMLNILNALKDRTRLKIIFELLEGKKCVSDIVLAVEMTQSAVSHQLKFLKKSNLVVSNKEGNKVFYNLSDDHVKSFVNLCLTHAREM